MTLRASIERWSPFVLCGLLAALFVAQLFALLTHRLDYPIFDDWRYYTGYPFIAVEARMPAELSLAWLFGPAQDTVHVTGKLLDWLTFRVLGHDYRLLAASSFAVWFGSWAFVSIALAVRITRDRPVCRSAALVAFALPLSAAPYWVRVSPRQLLEPAVAYHQMMPVLGLSLLCALCVARIGSTWRGCAAGALVTVFFSLVYSSGAFSHFLFGAMVVSLSSLAARGRARPLQGFGLAVALTAGACLAVHVLLPIDAFEVNPLIETRSKQNEVALPWDGTFWKFLLGLFDRAVLAQSSGATERVRGLVVVASMLLPAGLLAVRAARAGLDESERRIATGLVALLVAVLGYAALIAYGRASFGFLYFGMLEGPSAEARPSLYAHNRFFYWWITATLPFVVIAVGRALEALSRRSADLGACALAAFALASALPQAGAWNYAARYRDDARRLEAKIERDRAALGGPRARYRWAAKLQATFLDRWEFERESVALPDTEK